MRWVTLNSNRLMQAEKSHLLGTTPTPLAIALEHTDGETLRPIVLPAQNVSQTIPVGLLDAAEFRQLDFWQTVLPLVPDVGSALLARYNQAHSEIPAEVLLTAGGQKVNYRTLADWRELGQLPAEVLDLVALFDFPLNILRLWTRFEQSEQTAWLRYWRQLPFRKNYIRDIIQDFYDLSRERRAGVLDDIEALLKRSPDNKAAVAAEVHELVKRQRAPQVYEIKQQILRLRRKLDLVRGMQLDIPEDLEEHRLVLHLQFDSLRTLETQLDRLQSSLFRRQIGEIFEML
ncbi:MAG: hypothetical protein KDK30_08285 [Leptospiraceae bacterium]|nr:hypothetical protein [Leptospiraceae bacterium]